MAHTVVCVQDGPETLARFAASELARIASESVAARGAFRVAFPGGRTPVPLFRCLASRMYRDRIDWHRTEILPVDERAVPADHPDSNYRLLRRELIEPAGIPFDRVRRMRGEAPDLDAEAAACEPWYEARLDLLVLGLGPDGHVASLFPGHPAERERTRRVVAVHDSPKPPARRITITPPVIAGARKVFLMATGSDKAPVVASILLGTGGGGRMGWRPQATDAWADLYFDREAMREAARRVPALEHMVSGRALPPGRSGIRS